MKKFEVQLYESGPGSMAGPIIQSSGGTLQVCTAGSASKATIYDAAGAAMTNPISMTYGKATFYTLDTVSSVDVYGMAPKGQWFSVTAVKEGVTEVPINTQRRDWVAKVPFSFADSTAATEKDTGFDWATATLVLPNPSIIVVAADSGITVEVGTLSSESGGDADGYIDAVSCASAVLVKATIVNGANTMGALFEVQDSANAGDLTHEAHVITGAAAKSISYTLSSGADTAVGFALLPYILGGDLR